MKTHPFIVCLLILFLPGLTISQKNSSEMVSKSKETLLIQFAPACDHLTQQWVSDFQLLNPEIQCVKEIITGEKAPKSNGIVLYEDKNLINDQHFSNVVIVGRKVTVPVVQLLEKQNSAFLKSGLSPKALNLLLSSHAAQPKVIIVDDPTNLSNIRLYAGLPDHAELNAEIVTEDRFLRLMEIHPDALGFCLLTTVEKSNQNMHLVPLDKNENGRIESVENIFTDTEQLKWGIWLGKYPKSLISNVIASFSDVSHLTLEEQKFIQFLMTNGQEILVSSGISSLNFTERQSKLNALLTTPAISTQQTTGIFIPLLLIGLLFIVLSLIVLALFSLKQKNEQAAKASTSETKPIAINTIDVPKGLLYHPGHTWVFMEKDGNVKMGIDSFLSQLTGKITRIEVKAEGESVKKGETIVTLVQKGKQLNIKAPFSGIVREVNDELLTATELLNQSPFDKGWIYTLEASDWLTDVQLMFQSDRYLRWIQNEFDRVKELLRRIVQNKSPNNTAVVLLDGGAIREKILEEFGPENWEEFQQEFLS